MPTLYLRVNPNGMMELESRAALEQAVTILRLGGTVALPTETVYGLGANALDEAAVAKIFEAKRRPGWDPLIVHVCDEAMLGQVVAGVPEGARKLMEAFWPGPMTLLLPRSGRVPDAVTAGRSLVGVRMPRNPIALELIRLAGVPIAAPSANTFGHTSPTSARHVLDDLDGRIDAVVDGGETEFGVESTVIDANVFPVVIYRPGAVTIEQVRAVVGKAEMFREVADSAGLVREALPSPGVGVRHYAPRARLVLIEGDDDVGEVQRRLREETRVCGQERVGLMWPGEGGFGGEPGDKVVSYPWGKWSDLDELAHRLFGGLRELDACGCGVILCPVPRQNGVGAAIGDRLLKASFR